MKILLIRPHNTLYSGVLESRVGFPTGLFSIAASLEKEGHDVKVIDALAKNEYPSENLMGMSWEKLRREIISFRPSLAGITNQFSVQLENAFLMAKFLKEIMPHVIITVGGPHASSFPGEILAEPSVDFVVVGEGERAFSELARALERGDSYRGIAGLAWKEKGKVKINPAKPVEPLDSLPFPAYDLAPMEDYFALQACGFGSRLSGFLDENPRAVPVITSRGCPFNCIFCSIHASMGRKWRAHSPEYVIEHIKKLVKDYRVEFVHFEDDNLTLDKARFHVILEKLIPFSIGWDTPNGVRADTLDRETLLLMKRAGAREIRIAIESASERVLFEIIGKRMELRKAIEVARICHEIGLQASSFYVIGLPGETLKDMKKTLKLADELMKRYNLFPHLNIANPLPGTPLFELARRKGYLYKKDSGNSIGNNLSCISTESFSHEEVSRMFTRFHRKLALRCGLKLLKNPFKAFEKLKIFLSRPGFAGRMVRVALELIRDK